jgi:hypothetical protein
MFQNIFRKTTFHTISTCLCLMMMKGEVNIIVTMFINTLKTICISLIIDVFFFVDNNFHLVFFFSFNFLQVQGINGKGIVGVYQIKGDL